MAKLFGFSIEDAEPLSPSAVSPVPPNSEDGNDYYMSSGFFGQSIDLDGVYRTEFDLIKRYREMALHPEADSAIEDIVNEALVSDSNDQPVQLDLDHLNASDGIKKKIRDEFKYILDLMDFDKKAHEIYRNWYVDGRIYYHKVIDLKKPHEGLQEIRYIDAMKMRYVKKQKQSNKDKFKNPVHTDNPMDYEFPKTEEFVFLISPIQVPSVSTTLPFILHSDALIIFFILLVMSQVNGFDTPSLSCFNPQKMVFLSKPAFFF